MSKGTIGESVECSNEGGKRWQAHHIYLCLVLWLSDTETERIETFHKQFEMLLMAPLDLSGSYEAVDW